MKKIVCVLAVVMALSVFAEGYKFPGWNAEKSVYEGLIAQYDNAKDGEKPFVYVDYYRIVIANAFVGKTFESFEDLLAVCKSLKLEREDLTLFQATFGYYEKVAETDAKPFAVKIMQGCLAWAVAKDHAVKYMCCYNQYYCARGELNADDIVAVLFDGLKSGALKNFAVISRSLDCLYAYCPKCSMKPEKQLENFKALNRMYSLNLIEGDKEKWEPVIAKLRTVIASY